MITTAILKAEFEFCNAHYFEGRLPVPKFKTGPSISVYGSCWANKDSQTGELRNPVIFLSTDYEWTEESIRKVMVHEMIHYELKILDKEDFRMHGSNFKRRSRELRDRYGIDITIEKGSIPYTKAAMKKVERRRRERPKNPLLLFLNWLVNKFC